MVLYCQELRKFFEEAEDGKDVVLTLDASLQRTVEEQMQITMEQNNAEAAWCAVMGS